MNYQNEFVNNLLKVQHKLGMAITLIEKGNIVVKQKQQKPQYYDYY